MVDTEAREVLNAIEKANKIVILSGAGVSTLSGIKDFRGDEGLYKEKVYGLTPERILSSYFFSTHRELFYKYYLNHMMIPEGVEPNIIHYATKRLEEEGKLQGVVTQNIDGLYQKTGLEDGKIVEVHGNGNRWVCIKCKGKVNFEDVKHNKKTGNYFSPCHNYLVRPDIVLYDEMFSKKELDRVSEMYKESDLMLVMGTSLDIVYHKESVKKFKGKVVLINNTHVELGTRSWDAEYLGNIQDVFY